MIVFAGMTPHPPVLIPSIGKGEEDKVLKTKDSLLRLGAELAESDPDTIIFITPHMAHYPHFFNICGMSDLYGSFRAFNGASEYEWHGKNDTELASEIVDKAEDEGLTTIFYDNGEGEYELDHGITIPYFFLGQKLDFSHKILPIGYSSASRAEHYAFGQVISEVCERNTRNRVAIIASGDLSHRIGQKSQSGEEYRGEEFDQEFRNLLEKGDDYSLINLSDDLVERAGECGYRSALVLLGALSRKDFNPKIYSYESPFGIGYMVANMNVK
jgi:aromatic ring-opening dioxygenase LigB subunit